MDLLTLALAKNYTNNQQLAYEEEKVVLADVQLEDEANGTMHRQHGLLPLEKGRVYKVKMDDSIYTSTCQVVESRGKESLYLGNLSFIGNSDYPNTGENYLIVTIPAIDSGSDDETVFLSLEGATTCTVYSGGEIHGIDPKFLPEGGFGWTENTEDTLTFDGNLEGKEVIPIESAALIKISNDAIDLTSVKEIDTMFVFKGQLTPGPTLTTDYITQIEILPGANGLIGGNTPLVMSVEQEVTEEETGITLPAGTWIVYQVEDVADDGMYVSAIRFGNKVEHKIDPKYMPDYLGGIEVFNLPDYGIDLLSMLLSGQTELEHDNTALITDISNAITAGKVPAVHIDDMLDSAVITGFYLSEDIEFSLCGSMGGSWLRVTVIMNNSHIRLFTTAL